MAVDVKNTSSKDTGSPKTRRRKIALLFAAFVLVGAFLTLPRLRANPLVLVWLNEIRGDRSLEATLRQYQVQFVPDRLMRFAHAKSETNITPLWAFRPSHAVPTYGVPVVGDTDRDGNPEVYIGSFTRQLYALDGRTGRQLWQWKLPFGVIGGRVVGLVDLDGDGREEIVVGSHTTLPIRVYALKTAPQISERERLLWVRNLSGDFLEGGLSIIESPQLKSKLLVAATRDAPYSRGTLNILNTDGSSLYPPVDGLDICLAKPAVGMLPCNERLTLIHGSHKFYQARYGHQIVARDLQTGKILWDTQMPGDTGYQLHQIVDFDFDGHNDVVAAAHDVKLDVDKYYLLDGKTGKIERNLEGNLQGVLKRTKSVILAVGDSSVCLGPGRTVRYKIPRISFGVDSGRENGVILFNIALRQERLYFTGYKADTGKVWRQYSCPMKLENYDRPADYGVFGPPTDEIRFCTLADTDSDGSWNVLLQIRDFVINIALPIKVSAGLSPYAPVSNRNIDNSGVIYTRR